MMERLEPHRGKITAAVKVMNIFTICIALATIVSIIILFFNSDQGFIKFMVRLYTLVFCIVVIMIELGKPRAVAELSISRLWPVRGAFYAYLGFVALETADGNDSRSAEIFGDIMGWCLVGVGVFWVLAGVLCLNKVHAREQERFEEERRTHEAASRLQKATEAAAAPAAAST